MTFGLRLLLLKALLLISVTATLAQTPAERSAESLRAQLRDVEAKQSELQERSAQIDEEMKPENIERSLALTGSTRPEELREERRRQLENEKEKVRVQLDQLAASRTRLEAAIATADAEAYRQSALPASPASTSQGVNTVQSSRPAQKQRRRSARRRRPRRHRT